MLHGLVSKDCNMRRRPGVIKLQVALIDATTAIPGLRSVSVVVPQARILNLAQSMATDSYAFAGSAEAEMKATDSVSGELSAEAVDQRTGGMGLKSAASFEWGDAQNAMDYWSEKITPRSRISKHKPPRLNSSVDVPENL